MVMRQKRKKSYRKSYTPLTFGQITKFEKATEFPSNINPFGVDPPSEEHDPEDTVGDDQ
jgi:hypothetical protein